jgi:hypothetical protein
MTAPHAPRDPIESREPIRDPLDPRAPVMRADPHGATIVCLVGPATARNDHHDRIESRAIHQRPHVVDPAVPRLAQRTLAPAVPVLRLR